MKNLEMTNDKKFYSVEEVILKYFSKKKDTINRREFLSLLIHHYIDKPEEVIQEIDRVYNSSIRQFLISNNLDHKNNRFENMPGVRNLSKNVRLLGPKEVGRLGQMINDLKNFVFTYKDFSISKNDVKDCLVERRYSKYFYKQNEDHIDKTFYDSLHSMDDHYQFKNNDL